MLCCQITSKENLIIILIVRWSMDCFINMCNFHVGYYIHWSIVNLIPTVFLQLLCLTKAVFAEINAKKKFHQLTFLLPAFFRCFRDMMRQWISPGIKYTYFYEQISFIKCNYLFFFILFNWITQENALKMPFNCFLSDDLRENYLTM